MKSKSTKVTFLSASALSRLCYFMWTSRQGCWASHTQTLDSSSGKSPRWTGWNRFSAIYLLESTTTMLIIWKCNKIETVWSINFTLVQQARHKRLWPLCQLCSYSPESKVTMPPKVEEAVDKNLTWCQLYGSGLD